MLGFSRRGDEMIEVVYKEEKKEAVGNESFFQLPKNIRQIGEISAAYKIYMEDYVHTFMARIAGQESEVRVGLLLGKSNWMDGVTYIFIRSALLMENMEASLEHISFTDEIWQQAEAETERCFLGQQVVGWFFVMPECPMELTDMLYRTHLNYFGGNDKLLYMMEPLEKEEVFFHYENGCMSRQKGFYLYYDKNTPMQEYMIRMNKNIPIEKKEEVKDKAVQDFRKIISGKPVKETPEKSGGFSLLHAVGTCVVIGAVAVGITYLNNAQETQETSVETQQTVLREEETKDREAEQISENVTGTYDFEEEAKETEIPEETKNTLPEPAPSLEVTKTADVQEEQAQDTASQSQAAAQGSYVVQRGDTLSSISKRVYGSAGQINNICKLNNLNINDIIYPGQIILLP
jgi:LysM repeat protein